MLYSAGTSYIFLEEPGKLEQVAILASSWFKKYGVAGYFKINQIIKN